MAVEYDIKPEDQDKRQQDPCSSLEDQVVVGFQTLLPDVLSQEFPFILFSSDAQQQQYRADGNKKHMRFTERIESPVIQDDPCHNIHCAGFFHGMSHIKGCRFVIHQRVRIAELRHLHGCVKQQPDQADAYRRCGQAVPPCVCVCSAGFPYVLMFFPAAVFYSAPS